MASLNKVLSDQIRSTLPGQPTNGGSVLGEGECDPKHPSFFHSILLPVLAELESPTQVPTSLTVSETHSEVIAMASGIPADVAVTEAVKVKPSSPTNRRVALNTSDASDQLSTLQMNILDDLWAPQ
ncbi:hypothetical protein K443DRAFT_15376 [Laccaria amethystina LaAM-08-1]|uniref:Uncharacterized protein n=1 Tax=Laccaria amethystina LaAM-08-1 TaxID=1095629 RepID=A0A0C9X136_9AGAR|nr:hypothetical protein K443DRAFT_15376 [Laccaria amethystina LaAM-08-1]